MEREKNKMEHRRDSEKRDGRRKEHMDYGRIEGHIRIEGQ